MSFEPDPPDVSPSTIRRYLTIGVVVFLVVAAPLAGLLAWSPVEEGNVKIVKKWGATTGTTFEPGPHFINPVSQSTSSLSVRPQSYTMSSAQGEGEKAGRDDAIRVLTEDGLRVDIDVTIRYRVDQSEAVAFYKDYRTLATAEERLIRPSIRSVLRTEAGRLPVTEIYTGEGQTRLKAAAEKQLSTDFAESGLILEAVQVRNVELPTEYAKAVEQKEITEQRRQQKQSELEVEKLEADRKRIEARGEAEANRILSQSLDQRVLAQKYLDTLDETDTVYIPVGEGGYPQFVQDIDAGERSAPPQSTSTTRNATAETAVSQTAASADTAATADGDADADAGSGT